MGKSKDALLAEAKELNIKTDGLSYNDLQKAVKEAKADPTTDKTSQEKGSMGATENGAPDGDGEEKHNATVLRHLEAKAKRAKRAKKLKADAKKAKASEELRKSEAEKAKKSKDKRPIFTDDRGLKFKFKKTAPKSLNIDGKSRKTSDLIKDEEVMLELVYGNSSFIEQIH